MIKQKTRTPLNIGECLDIFNLTPYVIIIDYLRPRILPVRVIGGWTKSKLTFKTPPF